MDLRKQGYHLIIGFAPTCSTMTRIRQRNSLTRVRSTEEPWGFKSLWADLEREVHAANRLATATDALAWRAHSLFGADVTIYKIQQIRSYG